MTKRKKCAKCGKIKPLSEFGIRRRRGRTEPLSRCKVCTMADRADPKAKAKMKEYSAAAYERNKEKVSERARIVGDEKMQKIEEIKTQPCMDCGGRFPPECMDFDHRDPSTKSFGLSSARWKKWEDIEAEIAKCDLVCANCHRIRTKARGIKNQYA